MKNLATGWHREGRMWFSLLGGGVAWLLHFLTIWLLAEFGCASRLAQPGPLGAEWLIWGIAGATAAGLALGMASVATSRRCAGPAGTERFVAKTGVTMNGLFCGMIVVQTLPVFFHLQGCGGGAP